MAISIPQQAAHPKSLRPAGDPVSVMIVDDSAVVRGLVRRVLEEDPAIQVARSVPNGQVAIDTLRQQPVDVIVLDIEMPVMDGMTALPHLLAIDPEVRIIVASTLTTRNADISLRCLNAGAVDYVPKPTAAREIGGLAGGSDAFRRELIDKVLTHGRLRQRRSSSATPAGAMAGIRAASPPPFPLRTGVAAIALRKAAGVRPQVLAIGSSTGGPQALKVFLAALGRDFPLPIVIAQHMPPKFTAMLAEHIQAQTGRKCGEAIDGETLRQGQIYVAPGDFHLRVGIENGSRLLRLTQEAPRHYCRPAVDPLFESIAAAFGSRSLGAVLTGMGSDGLSGAQAIIAAGGTIVAQDEASSVVWGMPGAVATAGVCSAVQPLAELAATVRSLATGGPS